MKARALNFILILLGTIGAILITVFQGIKAGFNLLSILILIAAELIPIIWFSVAPYVTPGWIKWLLQNGLVAPAVVVENKMLDGVSYKGGDMWVEVPVEVKPAGEPKFIAGMAIRLSQLAFGMLKSGSVVTVKYNPVNKTKVVLAKDLVSIPAKRLDC